MKTITSPFSAIAIAACLALQAGPLRADSASPSELLEKGIYTEETKGDIDAAITIYQQLVTEAKNSQTLGAQAQFRLAQCYLKKNRNAEAQAAFEKLIHDFPNEKDLVNKAREHLPSAIVLNPVPWVDGERMQLNLKLPAGLDIGTAEYYADLAAEGGREVWRVGARMSAGATSFSVVNADVETFRPISSRWKHALLGDVSATYKKGEVELRRAGVAEPTVTKLDEAVFDNEEAVDVMRRLPLKKGYKTTIPLIASLGATTPISIIVEVTDEEDVEVPAGKFHCFKVKLNIGQTFWFSDDAHRYIVKFEAGGAVALLASVSQRKPGEAVQFHDEELGVSLTAPANWVVYRPKNRGGAKNQAILFIDPEADASDANISLVRTELLSKEARESARAWAESDFQENVSKVLKDVKIRPESWKDQEISGRKGVSYLADYTDNGKPRVAYSLHALGTDTAESFELSGPPEKFDALKAGFDSIVTSYKIAK